MEQHPNAKLTPRGRETLVSSIESGLTVTGINRVMTGDGPGHRSVEFNAPPKSEGTRHVRLHRAP